MLRYLTSKLRFRAALFVAVLYAFTMLVPHAAVALTGPNGAIHCLTVQNSGHEQTVKAHVHEDGVTHTHSSQAPESAPNSDDASGPVAACCGLFCAAGMVVSDARVLTPGLVTAIVTSGFPPRQVAGTGPDRINRPPIA